MKRLACLWEAALFKHAYRRFKRGEVAATFGLNGVLCVACGKETGCKPRSPAGRTEEPLESRGSSYLPLPPSLRDKYSLSCSQVISKHPIHITKPVITVQLASVVSKLQTPQESSECHRTSQGPVNKTQHVWFWHRLTFCCRLTSLCCVSSKPQTHRVLCSVLR